MIVLSSKPIQMSSIWDSMISKMSKKLVDQYSSTGTINASDVEKLNRLKELQDKFLKSTKVLTDDEWEEIDSLENLLNE